MILRPLRANILFEILNPVSHLKYNIEHHISNTVYEDGDLNVSDYLNAINSIKTAIIATVIITALLVLVCCTLVYLLCMFCISSTVDLESPRYVLFMFMFVGIITSIAQFLWWYCNNRIGYCIYLNILGTMFNSFYSCKYDTNRAKRHDALMHYFTCASKEWDYYDETSKLQ